jgi:citrate synthase
MRLLLQNRQGRRRSGGIREEYAGGAAKDLRLRASRLQDRRSARHAPAQDERATWEGFGQPKWYEMSRAIELYINKDKKLNANVDFYSASTYATLGIDIDLYTPIFAISRIAGWAAHVIEQLDDNRLIRPRAEYIGPEYPSPYIPIEQRG